MSFSYLTDWILSHQVVQYGDVEKYIICVTWYVVQNRQEIEIILIPTPGEHDAWVGKVNRIHLLMESLDDICIICYVCWVLQWLLEKQLPRSTCMNSMCPPSPSWVFQVNVNRWLQPRSKWWQNGLSQIHSSRCCCVSGDLSVLISSMTSIHWQLILSQALLCYSGQELRHFTSPFWSTVTSAFVLWWTQLCLC